MKIRIQGNTIRFRLSKQEVSDFAQNGEVKDKVEFGSSALVYQLIRHPKDDFSVDFVRGVISVNVPEPIVNNWANTEQVGFESDIVYPNNQKLELLIEKDFQCLIPRTEDESGLYANPQANNN
ncbi:DUF7009 family protein [Fulvivirga lutimaris]|uniref:DUF7009 family protein n=1 Tax=Fulvivirga lutimaris TaxID=1819566 RepID=UPI0012BD6C72|nr:hypothetical protein [Fulvivirga lutimaris]MTI38685.1 hypothetical protein [Fulvivirga lutimaris]